MKVCSMPAKAAIFNRAKALLGSFVAGLTLFGALMARIESDAKNAQSRLRPAEIYIAGTYTNVDYGFAVNIPSGLRGIASKPPAPNHGFRIRFSGGDSDWLGVVADYDTLEFSNSQRPDYSRAAPRGFEVLDTRKSSIKLGGMDAERIWQRLRRQSDGEYFITDDLGCRRAIRNEMIVYSLNLQTPERYYKSRVRTLNSIIASFRIIP